MIAKNIKGKSFKGCVNYVMNDTAQLLEAEGVWADNAKDMIRSFAMQRSGRKEIKQPVGHIPISFSPEDKPRMPNDFMLQLAKEYMQEMGIKNTQYIIVRHHNTDNDQWYGGGFAYPCLWKTDKADMKYRESWSDPRLPKTQKEKMNPKSPIIQKRNKGKRMS